MLYWWQFRNINLNILECKFFYFILNTYQEHYINLNILECKFQAPHGYKLSDQILI